MEKSIAIAALGALAQETRLDIFRLLVQKGPAGMPAGEIGDRLKLPSPTLSFHLNQLRFAGLVTSRRESRSIIYSANYDAMNELLAYLTENCCGGDPKQCAPGTCAPAETKQRPQEKRAQTRGKILA
ncbi:MAG TPA: metalloregulator ArsR/SmtB family transcription factor [Candidatus Binataceae bacterium]|nr:metalloregulator ArsR/SmtB family transcription factor [Candidatus Binataceae bacterium]